MPQCGLGIAVAGIAVAGITAQRLVKDAVGLAIAEARTVRTGGCELAEGC